MTEYDREGPQFSLPAWHIDVGDERPIDLRLLAGKRLDAKVRLAARLRPALENDFAQRADAAEVAALDEHVEEARRAQRRVASERLVDEIEIWIAALRPWQRRFSWHQ